MSVTGLYQLNHRSDILLCVTWENCPYHASRATTREYFYNYYFPINIIHDDVVNIRTLLETLIVMVCKEQFDACAK